MPDQKSHIAAICSYCVECSRLGTRHVCELHDKFVHYGTPGCADWRDSLTGSHATERPTQCKNIA